MNLLEKIFYISTKKALISGRLSYEVLKHFNDNAKNAELMLFSSGTTNIPKTIMLSSTNIQSNVESIQDYLKLNNEDRILLIKNSNHAASIIRDLLVGIYVGCTLYLTKKLPTSTYILSVIEKKDITVFFAVPSILIDILNKRNTTISYVFS